jgi:bifunctional non-homologous end joining protein LigD
MQVAAGSGQAPVGPDWVVELAWTGHRCIAYVEPGRRTRLLSSGGVSMTTAYPELVPELERRCPPGGMILDGTLVARGEEHAPRVARLQRRSARYRPTERHIRTVPVDLQVADLLWLDGHSLVDLPYRDRRALLEGLGFASAPVWTTSPMPMSELPSLLSIAEAKGVEALHARHLGSRYKPGQRSPLWVRVPVPRIGRVLVGGWSPVDPRRPDRIASLLVGVPERDGLRYVGRVGVSGDERRRPVAGLQQLRRESPPFRGDVPPDIARDAIWVEPRLVGLVDHTGFTADGRLRLPHWRGIVAAGSATVPWARREDPPSAEAGLRPADEAEPTRETQPAPSGPSGPVAHRAAEPPRPPDPSSDQAGEPSAADSPDHGREGARGEQSSSSATPVGNSETGGGENGSGGDQAEPEQARRLEQHFVYNSLNAIASLIRTDPMRARELLVGFADLSRATDRPAGAPSTLGNELATIRDYLALEQARFGKRLRVEIAVDPALHGAPIEPLRLLAAVRDAVQRDIEPRAQGGVLAVTAEVADRGCTVTVSGGAGEPRVLTFAAPAPV